MLRDARNFGQDCCRRYKAKKQPPQYVLNDPSLLCQLQAKYNGNPNGFETDTYYPDARKESPVIVMVKVNIVRPKQRLLDPSCEFVIFDYARVHNSIRKNKT